MRNTLIFLTFIPIQLIIGLLVAVLFYEEVFGWKFFRVVFYIPQIISALIIGYLFAVFFGYNGPVNLMLTRLGLGALKAEVLTKPLGYRSCPVCTAFKKPWSSAYLVVP